MEATQKNGSIKGAAFVVQETAAENIFTPEDFSEEQIMMKESVQEFVSREIIPHRERFENKDYAFNHEVMQKAGELVFLGVAVP
jgi:alkylation response protein AidB-like acyl-CoA dehydrogenase